MLRARQRLGKYRIVKRISAGPLATVYRAFDTVLGAPVALKIPAGGDEVISDLVREARVASRLEHKNILSIRDAGYIDGNFVVAMALGEESLADRIERRISRELALNFAAQVLAGVSHAHAEKIIHCDIKPENYILFPGNKLKLCDFGFAKHSVRTLKASGSGTIEYIAPEQAMGRPRFQSDVFSLGLVLCRLFSGRLPEWPFDWPPEGIDRMRRWLPPATIAVLQKSVKTDPKLRFANAVEFEQAFHKSLKAQPKKRKKKKAARAVAASPTASWRNVQHKEFRQRYGKVLDAKFECRRCSSPVSERMQYCPWCAEVNPTRGLGTTMARRCPHCDRGVKMDWTYCSWCFGRRFEAETSRRYVDKRYTGRCAHPGCGGPLMPFMKYCPWCHTKVQRRWRLPQSSDNCARCGWGVAAEYWQNCAWCGYTLKRSARGRRK